MSIIPALIAVLILTFTAFAQNSNMAVEKLNDGKSANSNIAEIQAGSTIRGIAVYADTNKPLRRAKISLLSRNLDSLRQPELTDDEGRFVIRKAMAGTYYFSVDVPGVLNPNAFRSIYRSSIDSEINTELLDRDFDRVTVDGTSDSQVIVRVRRAGVITGSVTYADGMSAVGVSVFVVRKTSDFYESSKNSINVQTDDRGIYRFFGLPDGQYLVYAVEPSRHAIPQYSWVDASASELKAYYPDARVSKDAKLVEVSAGLEQTAINITIPDRKYFSLSGTVTAKSDGRPVKALIRFVRMDDPLARYEVVSSSYGREVSADANGRFEIKELPKGNYQLTISPPYEYISPNADDETAEKTVKKLASIKREIEIGDADIANFDVNLPVGAVIRGVVIVDGKSELKEPITLITREVENLENSASTSVSFSEGDKKRKEFEIEGVTGKSVFFSGWTSGPYFVKDIRLGTTDLIGTRIDVKEGETISGVEYVISDRSGVLKGKVLRTDPADDFRLVAIVPVGATVSLSTLRSRFAEPKPDGTFEIFGAPGEYFVIQADPMDIYIDEDWDVWYKRVTSDAERITIKAAETTTIELKLPSK